MSFILIISIVIRLVAFGWSISLIHQLRDWRIIFLSGMLALMAIRQVLTMIRERESWAIAFHWHVEELPGLVVSILAFFTLFYLKSIITKHDQAVAERYESEAHLANIVDTASDAIITVDNSQCIISFNQGAEKVFGYSAEEVLGQPLDILLPPHFVKVHRQHIRTFATATKSTRRMGELSQEIFGLRKDGSEFPADASISRLIMDDEVTFIVILRDITNRVRLEESVKKSEKHLRNVLNGLGPHMLVGLMTPEGRLIEANLPALGVAGLKPEDVLGKPFEETYWWAYSEAVKKQLHDTICRVVRGETCRYDVVIRVAENHFITIDFCLHPLLDGAGNVIYLIASAVDITERKLAEDHIQHLRNVLEAIRNVNQLIVREKNQQRLLQGACDIINQTRKYKLVWIGMLQEGSKDVLPTAQAGLEDNYLKSVKITWDNSETGKGPTGTAIKTRMPFVMQKITDESRHDPWREQALKQGYASSASVPLVYRNRVFGALNVYSSIPDAFDEEEVNLLTEASRDIGFALHSIELEEKHKRAEAKMEHLALYDTLTDLPNRTLLHKLIQQSIASVDPKASLALLSIGVDRFKAINETLGHPVGDRALQKIAKRLQQFSHGVIPVARLGGDIFALLLTPIEDSQQPFRTAHEILEVFATPLKLEGYTIDVEMSIGIALYPYHGKDADTLMVRTEVAMGTAKSAHSRIAAYDTGMEQYTLEHLQLAGELRQAIEQNELILHYQPKINMSERCIIGVEALVRWQHPEKGFMAPDLFIPMAEQTALIHPLTYWVLNEAFAQISQWHQQGLELVMAVNLAVQNLLDAQLVSVIAKGLQDYEVEPAWLMLEITESDLMADPVRAQKTLQQLHAMGVRLSIDDFGTGHSSLAYLKDLPVDELKIDQSFVLNMSSDETQAMIVRATISLAHNLGLTTTAEGVETEAVWEQLQALDCNVAQGYFISRPLTSADFMRWLKESTWKIKSSP